MVIFTLLATVVSGMPVRAEPPVVGRVVKKRSPPTLEKIAAPPLLAVSVSVDQPDFLRAMLNPT
jgi:hypothetical protein